MKPPRRLFSVRRGTGWGQGLQGQKLPVAGPLPCRMLGIQKARHLVKRGRFRLVLLGRCPCEAGPGAEAELPSPGLSPWAAGKTPTRPVSWWGKWATTPRPQQSHPEGCSRKGVSATTRRDRDPHAARREWKVGQPPQSTGQRPLPRGTQSDRGTAGPVLG